MNNTPLPEKLRPRNLREFFGQKNLTGRDGIVRKLITSAKNTDFFPSIIFWGPPGSGKTTLARIISSQLKREFYEFSAVNTSVKDIQNTIGKCSPQNKLFASPVIFIDEIHRFNKAQQDRLLPHIEKGDAVLIGATTENPSFEIISPLLSRSRVLVFSRLEDNDLREILKKGEQTLEKKVNEKAKKFLIGSSNGDARVLLNVLEISVNLTHKKTVSLANVESALQRRQLSFDKKGKEYYNIISAFIKSMRASQENAALYYLARMVEAGQDPLYIARRMVVFASEDIGMAQPTALVVANEVFRACETIGYPECKINLAHGVVYLCKAKKDRRVYDGIESALIDVKKHGNLPIPMNIRNAPTKLMKELGYGKEYEIYTKKSLLPNKLKKKKYFM